MRASRTGINPFLERNLRDLNEIGEGGHFRTNLSDALYELLGVNMERLTAQAKDLNTDGHPEVVLDITRIVYITQVDIENNA